MLNCSGCLFEEQILWRCYAPQLLLACIIRWKADSWFLLDRSNWCHNTISLKAAVLYQVANWRYFAWTLNLAPNIRALTRLVSAWYFRDRVLWLRKAPRCWIFCVLISQLLDIAHSPKYIIIIFIICIIFAISLMFIILQCDCSHVVCVTVQWYYSTMSQTFRLQWPWIACSD